MQTFLSKEKNNIKILNTDNQNLITMLSFAELDKVIYCDFLNIKNQFLIFIHFFLQKFQMPIDNLEKFKNIRHDTLFSPEPKFEDKILGHLPQILLQRYTLFERNGFFGI